MTQNQIEYVVHGKYALFTDPVTRIGGEKFTYQIPTYEALKGITESIYWKPTITWVIDAVRIMNPIQTEAKGMRRIKYKTDKINLAYYTYLREPVYQVKAHFEFNRERPDLRHDRNEKKHYEITRRSLEKGGRRDIFLGTRDCQGYVEPCTFGEGRGFYDDYTGDIHFGPMFHGFTYPDENPSHKFQARLWVPVMQQGVITFIRPDECNMIRDIKTSRNVKPFTPNQNMTNVHDEHDDTTGGDPS